MEDGDSNPGFSRPKKPAATGEEDIMELLWQNGQVVVRPPKKGVFDGGGEREIRSSEQQHLFMQEDEMSAWLHYPLDDFSFDRDLYADLLYSAPTPPPSLITAAILQPKAVAEIRPPPPPVTKPDNSPRLQNFVHFSRLDSMVGPVVSAASMPPQVNMDMSAAAGDLTTGTCESSPGGSRNSFSASEETHQKPPALDRKRKAREIDDNECPSEDMEFEAAGDEAKKHTRGSTSTKRSRAAEVHNQSERRRRDKINEKMRALQELIPRCNKSDKASMLDEAIEYMKSLQLQVQMMSMGCGMVPMMYPGGMQMQQQLMPAMGMEMNRAMLPPYHPSVSMVPAAAPNPAAYMAAPRFPVLPPFHMPPPTNQTHPPQNLLLDPYHHQFLALHQLPLPQNQAVMHPPGIDNNHHPNAAAG